MFRQFLIRLLTLGFALLTFYFLAESVFNIFYVYPHLFGDLKSQNIGLDVQAGLFERTIYTYFSLIIYSFLGLTFLTTPSEEIKNIHLLAGALIFITSILFFREQLSGNLIFFLAKTWYLK